jgi:hypothetical protein
VTTSPSDEVPPGNVFAAAVAACNAALAADAAAGAALDAGLAELDRRTAEELSFYEMVGNQASNDDEDNPS